MTGLHDSSPNPAAATVRRHGLVTRLWHWLNVLCLFVLFKSGLGIFNAHPRLYWGQYGANFDHAWLEKSRFGALWTLPSTYDLALSRRWHFTFALVFAFGLLAFMLWSLANGHFRRDMRITREDVSARHLSREVADHARLRFPKGLAALRYNSLQKWTYVAVIFGLLPVMIFTGLAMSPGMDAAWPWLLDLFGGRQSARSIHFIAAWALVAFLVVHIVMVLLAGPLNLLRGIITGRMRVSPEETP